MNRKESIVRSESILRRLRIGKISPAQAADEFDHLLWLETGVIAFHSDNTGLFHPDDPNLIVFPKNADPANPIPSNTGIYARGPRRGEIVVWRMDGLQGEVEGGEMDCDPEVLAHFQRLVESRSSKPL